MRAAHLEPMTFEEYDSVVTHLVADHARQQVESGLFCEPEATSYARAQHERVLPAGIATPNHHLWTVRDAGGAQVGVLWLHVRPRDGGGRVEAFVYDVEVAPHARGRGLGRATMLAAEDAARGLGAELMRLNVFGHNRAAIGLYTALGYDAAMLAMTRRVAEPVAERDAGRRLVSADMTGEDFAGFRARLEDDLAAGLARSQLLPEQVAREEARAAVTRLLPDGRATAGALLFTVSDGDTVVADLWLQVIERPDGSRAQAHLLVQEPTLSAEVLAMAEGACRVRRLTHLDVTVQGFDDAARALYESFGYAPTAMQMLKRLTA